MSQNVDLTCIIGHPRSGSSALALHMSEHGYTLLRDDRPGWDHEQTTECEIFERNNIKEIDRLLHTGGKLLIKSLANTFLIERITDIVPSVKFIAIIRDPRDQVLSFLQTPQKKCHNISDAIKYYNDIADQLLKYKDNIDFISYDEVCNKTGFNKKQYEKYQELCKLLV